MAAHNTRHIKLILNFDLGQLNWGNNFHDILVTMMSELSILIASQVNFDFGYYLK
jgi:hypothetical protein